MWVGQRAWVGLSPVQILHLTTTGQLPFAIPEDMPQGVKELLCACLW